MKQIAKQRTLEGFTSGGLCLPHPFLAVSRRFENQPQGIISNDIQPIWLRVWAWSMGQKLYLLRTDKERIIAIKIYKIRFSTLVIS